MAVRHTCLCAWQWLNTGPVLDHHNLPPHSPPTPPPHPPPPSFSHALAHPHAGRMALIQPVLLSFPPPLGDRVLHYVCRNPERAATGGSDDEEAPFMGPMLCMDEVANKICGVDSPIRAAKQTLRNDLAHMTKSEGHQEISNDHALKRVLSSANVLGQHAGRVHLLCHRAVLYLLRRRNAAGEMLAPLQALDMPNLFAMEVSGGAPPPPPALPAALPSLSASFTEQQRRLQQQPSRRAAAAAASATVTASMGRTGSAAAGGQALSPPASRGPSVSQQLAAMRRGDRGGPSGVRPHQPPAFGAALRTALPRSTAPPAAPPTLQQRRGLQLVARMAAANAPRATRAAPNFMQQRWEGGGGNGVAGGRHIHAPTVLAAGRQQLLLPAAPRAADSL